MLLLFYKVGLYDHYEWSQPTSPNNLKNKAFWTGKPMVHEPE